MSLCCNAKINIPTMYEVLDKDTTTSEILRHLSVAKCVAMSQRVIRRELFNADSTSRKPLVNGPLLLPFHAAVLVAREQHALQPLALAAASVHVFRAVVHSRLFTANLFCLVSGKKFNIMSALFVHQSLTLPQKTDSREGLF